MHDTFPQRDDLRLGSVHGLLLLQLLHQLLDEQNTVMQYCILVELS